VPDLGYLPKTRRDLEEVNDLLALGDEAEAGKLWQELGFVPMELEKWDGVYEKLQQIALKREQALENRLVQEGTKVFQLETELKSTRRTLKETENECEMVKSALIAGKRSQDPAEVIVLRMQIKALEEGIAERDRDIGELTQEVALCRAEEVRLGLILQADLRNAQGSKGNERKNTEESLNLMQKVQELTAENEVLAGKIEEQGQLQAIIDQQTAKIAELQAFVPTSPPPNTLQTQLSDLQSALSLEESARTQATAQLQDTLTTLQASHAQETLQLTRQLAGKEALAMQANLRLQELEEQLADLLDRNTHKEREICALEETNEDLEAQKASISGEYERVCREVMAQRAENAAISEELRETAEALAKAKGEGIEIRAELQTFRSQMAQIRAKNSDLETEVQTNQLNFDLQLAHKLSETAEIRKLLESDKRLLEGKIEKMEAERLDSANTHMTLQHQREELRLDLEAARKKSEILQEDHIRLTCVLESLQLSSSTEYEHYQAELTSLKRQCEDLVREKQGLEGRVRELRVAEEQGGEAQRALEELRRLHVDCGNAVLRVRKEAERDREEMERQRNRVERDLQDCKLRFAYLFNLYRVREVELIALRAATSVLSPSIVPKSPETLSFQSRLSAQDLTITELQKRLITQMTQSTQPFGPVESSFEGQEVRRALVEWVNGLPEWVRGRLRGEKMEKLLEIREIGDAISSVLGEISGLLASIESPNPPFDTLKAAHLLDKLDRGSGPIDQAVSLSLLIHNEELQKELVHKSAQMIEQNAYFQREMRESEGQEKELWTIQRWHESEKETLQLRNSLLGTSQRLADFYRSQSDLKQKLSESDDQKTEILSLKSALEKSQSRLKALESRVQTVRTLENQKETYENVVQGLREQVGKREGELEVFRAAWERGVGDLKKELLDFGGEAVRVEMDSPERTLSAVIGAFKAVRGGLNQRISELERRLAGIVDERDSDSREKSLLTKARDQARQEADKLRIEARELKLQLDRCKEEVKTARSRSLSEARDTQSVAATADLERTRRDLEAAKSAFAAAQVRVKSLESENRTLNSDLNALKSVQIAQSQDLLRDLQTKTELIERLVGDNESTKQHYHRQELALRELLCEKEEALQRLEAVQVTTASWSFRRRSSKTQEN